MQQFINACYFVQFSARTRLVNLKVILCVLLIALVILSIVLHGLHVSVNVPVKYADSDPWNG